MASSAFRFREVLLIAFECSVEWRISKRRNQRRQKENLADNRETERPFAYVNDSGQSRSLNIERLGQ
jgi:hypothetical protein